MSSWGPGGPGGPPGGNGGYNWDSPYMGGSAFSTHNLDLQNQNRVLESQQKLIRSGLYPVTPQHIAQDTQLPADQVSAFLDSQPQTGSGYGAPQQPDYLDPYTQAPAYAQQQAADDYGASSQMVQYPSSSTLQQPDYLDPYTQAPQPEPASAPPQTNNEGGSSFDLWRSDGRNGLFSPGGTHYPTAMGGRGTRPSDIDKLAAARFIMAGESAGLNHAQIGAVVNKTGNAIRNTKTRLPEEYKQKYTKAESTKKAGKALWAQKSPEARQKFVQTSKKAGSAGGKASRDKARSNGFPSYGRGQRPTVPPQPPPERLSAHTDNILQWHRDGSTPEQITQHLNSKGVQTNDLEVRAVIRQPPKNTGGGASNPEPAESGGMPDIFGI